MSIQHKLYDYEVSPPAEVWNSIAIQLDELDELKTVSQKLQHLQIAPPPSAWERIAAELNEEASFNIISKKLGDLSVVPPSHVWHKIETSLDKPETKIVAMQPVKNRLIKYAAAACVIGLLGFFGYRLFESSSKDTDRLIQIAAQNNSVQQHTAAKTSPNVINTQGKQSNTQKTVSEPVSAASNTNAGMAVIKTPLGNAYSTTLEKNRDIKGRYIVLMTDDGNVVRMSKKLGNIADCIAGESPDEACNDQITQWQKELAVSNPDNFLNLLEMASNASGM